MSLLTLDNKLYLSPIDDHLQSVLDVGTGTGIWAIEFGTIPVFYRSYGSGHHLANLCGQRMPIHQRRYGCTHMKFISSLTGLCRS